MENGTDLLESTPVQVEDVAKEYEKGVSALKTKGGGAYHGGGDDDTKQELGNCQEEYNKAR